MLTITQTGVGVLDPKRRVDYYRSLQTIPAHPSRYIASYSREPPHAANTQESGSVPLQLRGAYSMRSPKNPIYPAWKLTDSRALSRECHDAGLNVYVTSDTSDVYEDKFRAIARGDSGNITPTLILLGLRLGIDRVTPAYWEGLKAILQYPQSVGIAG